jgi:hypothetical protein
MLLAPAPAHRSCLQPVLSFDLGAPVGDVAWAPFSSTVFAAVTDGGRAHVFDLAQNRDAAVCVQYVPRKARCTKLAFNARHPVLLVGDEQGGVTCLKLSPNLRRSFNQGERLHACMHGPLPVRRGTHLHSMASTCDAQLICFALRHERSSCRACFSCQLLHAVHLACRRGRPGQQPADAH